MPLVRGPKEVLQEKKATKHIKDVIADDTAIATKELPIRSMIVAPKDYLLIEFDLSQAETWVTAYLANDPKMKHFLKNSDIHTETAVFIFDTPFDSITFVQRYLGKKGNHSLSYGSTYYMLARSINIESDNPPYVTVSLPESKHIFMRWHELYPNIEGVYWTDTKNQLQKNRMLVTPHGREAMFFQAWGDELFKTAYAYVPQSTVADHLNGMAQDGVSKEGGLRWVKKNIANVDKYKTKVINQSHDSFVLESHKSMVDDIIPLVYKALYRPLVINHEEFYIPVDCKIGERWGELEKRKVA